NDQRELEDALKLALHDTILLRYFLNNAKKSNYNFGEAYTLIQLGSIYFERSRFEKAIFLYNEALEVTELIEDITLKVHCLNKLGAAYQKTEAIQSAIDHIQRALEIAGAIENPSKAIQKEINRSLNNMGSVYNTLGQWDFAISKYDEAIKNEMALNNYLGLAKNHQDKGESLEAQGNLKEALISYNTALAYNAEIQSPEIHVKSNLGIAHIYVHQSKFEDASVIFKKILDPALKLGNMELLSELYINMGWDYIELGQFDSANDYLIKGAELAQTYNLPIEMEEAYIFLSDLNAAEGDFKNALGNYKEARTIERRSLNDRNRRYMADLISRAETENKNRQIAELAKENEMVKSRLRKNQTTILVSVLVLGLIIAFFYLMNRQSQSNYEKRVLSMEQHMLRSQMNPHFLFNSLNSIKLYIINNDKKNAVHYLNKFSKLVRRILEGSSLKEAPLADELETIELYLNIENIRFSDDIKYNITVDPNINVNKVKIPSLMLQPFLENAIWHGLSSKEGPKNIWVTVKKKDNMHIVISIEDNGVGRMASAQIKENRVLQRKSVGIDITKERIANFAQNYQFDHSVEIIDLFDEQGMPKGTKVVLEIPTV
ncbi:MAG: tetratricopeptide repeat protein, partial [Croceitalea sp.]|nr:tetratricopeptide repeat protein [Croceitalea sp.]